MSWSRDFDSARIEAAALVQGTHRGLAEIKAKASTSGAVVYHERAGAFIKDQLAKLDTINRKSVIPHAMRAPPVAVTTMRDLFADARRQIDYTGRS